MKLFSMTLRQALILNRQCCRQFSTSRVRPSENLPSIAPKSFIHTKPIWQDPELYARNCRERNYNSQSDTPIKIAQLHEEWLQEVRALRGYSERRNAIQKQLSRAHAHGLEEEKTKLSEEARKLERDLAPLEERETWLREEKERLAAELPNLTSDETPRASQPIDIGSINKLPAQDSSYSRNHVHIGKLLDLLDFQKAATTSGRGWYFLKHGAALLEQALVQYTLKIAMEHGFTIVTPPSIAYSHIASACGFRPRDPSTQIYNIAQVKEDQDRDSSTLSLAGTAEIPLAGMEANQILNAADLPLKVVGPSRCYRAEAGAYGQESKGLYRVHEFTKVEMFAWTAPGAEMDAFDSILSVQKTILQNLGLYCRILEMPSSDLGHSAYRKVDIEAYFPSRRQRNDGWGEVTSASICTDYQTRRLNTRVENSKGSAKKTSFPYTVNGTAVAVPRVLAAILENGWDEKGEFVSIPEVLWPWMNGLQTISKKKR